MKSIMEEASTIFKAIEKAWIRAEKPQSFSVKLLEEPTKNFIGMTTKPAKIAFLFDEVSVATKQVRPHQPQPTPQPARKPHAPAQQQERQPKRESHASAQQQQRPAAQPQPKRQPENRTVAPRVNDEQSTAPRENQPLWQEDMARGAEEWLKETLTLLGQQVPPFTSEIKNKHLIIAFEKAIVEDSHQEHLLFSSLAHLVLQATRNKFKNQARGLKIILKTNS